MQWRGSSYKTEKEVEIDPERKKDFSSCHANDLRFYPTGKEKPKTDLIKGVLNFIKLNCVLKRYLVATWKLH